MGKVLPADKPSPPDDEPAKKEGGHKSVIASITDFFHQLLYPSVGAAIT
jgi:hypothetical protein